jgi:hypothetical protein
VAEFLTAAYSVYADGVVKALKYLRNSVRGAVCG